MIEDHSEERFLWRPGDVEILEWRTAKLFNPPSSGHKGLLVSLHVDAEAADELAAPDGESADSLHITLAYCGDVGEVPDIAIARAITGLSDLAERSSPLCGSTIGLGRFSATEHSDDKDVVYARVDVPGLLAFRQAVANILTVAGVPPKANFVYTPHITLAYVDPEDDSDELDGTFVPLTFTALFVSIGDEQLEIPLGTPSRGAGSNGFQ